MCATVGRPLCQRTGPTTVATREPTIPYLTPLILTPNEDIVKVKKEMSQIQDIKSLSILLRSKEREIEEGEKCTCYFFKKITSKGRVLTKLKKEDGDLTANT